MNPLTDSCFHYYSCSILCLALSFVRLMKVVLLVIPSGASGGASRRSVEWWCVQAVGCGSVVAGDGLKFLVIDDEGKASVATSPLCCFHRGCAFCALLLEVVYRCVGGLSDNLAEGNCCDFCSYRLAHGLFVGCR